MDSSLVKLLIQSEGNALVFAPQRVSGDILYLSEKPINFWEDKVTAKIILGMTHYSPGSGQEYCD